MPLTSEQKIEVIKYWGRTVKVRHNPNGGYNMSCAVEGHHSPLRHALISDSYDSAISKAYCQVYWSTLDSMIKLGEVEPHYTDGHMYLNP